MTYIYDVKIESLGLDNQFRITWQEAGTTNSIAFECGLPNHTLDAMEKWEKEHNQKEIGRALFEFLDGCGKTEGYFSTVLEHASENKHKLQVNLHNCEETADWPFELMARGDEFLLLERIHLVRWVSNRGISSNIPLNDSIRLLFMAGDPLFVEHRLHYEAEEEAILNITRDLPIEIDVEDSGSLKGLQKKLVLKRYDVVHLSAHGEIKNGEPYLKLEDETGKLLTVHPEELWDEAFLENPPRLLFLSACRSGQTSGSNKKGAGQTVSLAGEMVERFRIPAVLGWGKYVYDQQARLGGEELYHQLSRGHSILEAVQQARYKMNEKFPNSEEPAWPQLRLYSNGTPLKAICTGKQVLKPKPRQVTHSHLADSRINILPEGFIGRRRQIQFSLRALDENNYEVLGVLLLGTHGLGKSCLAGKVSERFPYHSVIAHQGKLDAQSIAAALKKAFQRTGDEKGLEIISKEQIAMTDRLADLCATSFKVGNYFLLLDGFEQNIEKIGQDGIGTLVTEAGDLLYSLLYYLPYSCKMTLLTITSRFPFELVRKNRDFVQERLKNVWFTDFQDAEISRKIEALENLSNRPNDTIKNHIAKAEYGNPLLLEQMDQAAGQMQDGDDSSLLEAIDDLCENFLQQTELLERYRHCDESLKLIVERLLAYSNPVSELHIRQYETKITNIPRWQELLQEGTNLGLLEHNQAEHAYRLTPLLREKL